MGQMELENHTMVTEFILLGLTSRPDEQRILFATCLLMFLATILGNFLIIALIWTDSRLHTPMYFFISNLSLLDICFTLATVPKMLANMLSERKSISFASCAAQLCFTLCCGITECFILALMAFDRYVAICRPLRYLLIMNRRICGIMIMSCWAGGFSSAAVLTGVTFSFPYCGPNHVDHFFCEQPAVLQLVCVDTSSVEVLIFALSVVVLMLPFFFILASYVAIAGAVLGMSSAAGRHRAFSTCSSHLTVVTMFYSTISFTYLRPRAMHSLKQEKKVAIFYSIVSPMLNPVIYSLRNKDVKGAFAKVLGKR